MTDYFGRVYELTIGNSAGEIRRFDGVKSAENDPLQITFSIDQTPSSHRAYGEITVYGLNRKSRKDIYEQFSEVTLAAGYRSAMANIFSGSIENVEIGRSGTDTFVKLFCQSGAGVWQNVTLNKPFGINTPQKEIIRFAAESFGFPVEFIGDFDDLPPALNGRTLDGDGKYEMNKLATGFTPGFEWLLSNGTMLVVRKGAQRPDAVPFKYKPTNGLIGTPEITQQGVNIEVLLNPFLRPYDLYTVESETGQLTFNGVYYQRQGFPKTNGEGSNRVISFRHEGDFYGDKWQTSIEGQRIDE